LLATTWSAKRQPLGGFDPGREPVSLIDPRQQGREVRCGLQWKCSSEAASPYIQVALCEQAHGNETFAAHASSPV
jgi:hypothetical protein